MVVREEHPPLEQRAFQVEFFEEAEGGYCAGEDVFHADKFHGWLAW